LPIDVSSAARVGEHKVRMVLVVLADHADSRGVAWPGRETIAAEALMHRRDVDLSLRELVRCGLISRTAAAAGPGRPARYQLAMPMERAGDPRHVDDRNAPGIPGASAGERAGEPRREPEPAPEADPPTADSVALTTRATQIAEEAGREHVRRQGTDAHNP